MKKAVIKTIKTDGQITYPRTVVEAIKNSKGQTLADLLDECSKTGSTVTVATDMEAIAGESNDIVMTPYLVRKFIEENDIGSGSTGGVEVPTLVTTLKDCAIAEGEVLSFTVTVKSNSIGVMTLYVLDNGVVKYSETVKQGSHTVKISNLDKGNHAIQVYAIDRANKSTNTESFTVIVGGLTADIEFDTTVDRQFGNTVSMGVTISTTLVGDIYATLVTNNNSESIKVKKGYNSITIPSGKLKEGSNVVTITVTCGTFSTETESFTFILKAGDGIYSTLVNEVSEVEAGTIRYDAYQVVANGVNKFHIDWKIVRNGAVSSLKSEEVNSGLNTLVWTVPSQTGDAILKANISSASLYKQFSEGSISESEFKNSSEYKEIEMSNLTIIEAQNVVEEFETGNMLCSYETKGHSNTDIGKETWSSLDGSDKINIYGASFGSNGWVDGVLVLNAGAYAINTMKLLSSDYSEVTMQTRIFISSTGDLNPVIIDMMGGTGFQITGDEFIVKTSAHTVLYPIVNDEWIDLGFTMSKRTGLLKLYVNGCIVEPRSISNTENIISTKNITFGTDSSVSQTSPCKIAYFKMYSRSLTDAQIVNNYIAGLPTVEEQVAERERNNGRDIPEMRVYVDEEVLSTMTKDNKIRVRVVYNGKTKASSFEAPNTIMSWQGTSSIQYAVKNYKIKLRDDNDKKIKYKLTDNTQEESTFCLKADYMESSHMSNTGTAKWVNDNLYTEKIPPQVDDPEGIYRTAIDGYPIELYINDKYEGIYNFNLDKSCTNTFGLDDSKYPNVLSIEVSANSDVSAGAFNVWDMDSIRSDFELRYPDQDDLLDAGGEDLVRQKLAPLQSLIQWVKTSTDEEFVRDIEQHFNKQYLLRYFLQVFIFGMVDNLGKNMFLNTWDGQIWYPSFYDLDSELGLDNSGYLLFDPYIEVTSSVFNTSSSVLWTRVQTLFKTELENEYRDMRNTNYMYNKIISHFEDYVKDLSPTHYNNDCTSKYINHQEYLFMAHGSRMEHFRSWMRSRLIFCDSYFNYDAVLGKYITFRANRSGTNSISIKTNETLYMSVKFRNTEDGSGTVRKLCKKGETVSFSGYIATSTDQEVIIYGAPYLYTFNIDSLYPSKVLPGEAVNLREISISSDKLVSISLVNNVKLKSIYLSGSKLGSVVGTESLDLSNCSALEFINVFNTGLKSVNLCPGIVLYYCALPGLGGGSISLSNFKCKYYYIPSNSNSYVDYLYAESVEIEKYTEILKKVYDRGRLEESRNTFFLGLHGMKSCFINECKIKSLLVFDIGNSIVIKNSDIDRIQIAVVAQGSNQSFNYHLYSDVQMPVLISNKIGVLVLSKSPTYNIRERVNYTVNTVWDISSNKIEKFICGNTGEVYIRYSSSSNFGTSESYSCESTYRESYDPLFCLDITLSQIIDNTYYPDFDLPEEIGLLEYMLPSYETKFDMDILIPKEIKVFVNPLMIGGKVGTKESDLQESIWNIDYTEIDYFIQNVKDNVEVNARFSVKCISRDSNIKGYTLSPNKINCTYEDKMLMSQLYASIGTVSGHKETSWSRKTVGIKNTFNRGVFLDFSEGFDFNSDEGIACDNIGKSIYTPDSPKDYNKIVFIGKYKINGSCNITIGRIPSFDDSCVEGIDNIWYKMDLEGDYNISSELNSKVLVTGNIGTLSSITNPILVKDSTISTVSGTVYLKGNSVIGEYMPSIDVEVTGDNTISCLNSSAAVLLNTLSRVLKIKKGFLRIYTDSVRDRDTFNRCILKETDISEMEDTLRVSILRKNSDSQTIGFNLTEEETGIINKVSSIDDMCIDVLISYYLLKKVNENNKRLSIERRTGSKINKGSVGFYIGSEDTSNMSIIADTNYVSERVCLFLDETPRDQVLVNVGLVFYSISGNEPSLYKEVNFIKRMAFANPDEMGHQHLKVPADGLIYLSTEPSFGTEKGNWSFSSSSYSYSPRSHWSRLDTSTGTSVDVGELSIPPYLSGPVLVLTKSLSIVGDLKDENTFKTMLSEDVMDITLFSRVNGTIDSITEAHKDILKANKSNEIKHYVHCYTTSSSAVSSVQAKMDSLNVELESSGKSVLDSVIKANTTFMIPTDSSYWIDLSTVLGKIKSIFA